MKSVHTWADLKDDELAPGLHRRMLSGEKLTLARFEVEKGAQVPGHRHENEQISCVLAGTVRFTLDGEDVEVKAGQVLHIPANVHHSMVALETATLLDVFAPPRYDWIQGENSYFQGG